MSKADDSADTITGVEKTNAQEDAGKLFGEHIRDQTSSSDRNRWATQVRKGIEEANRRLVRGEMAEVGAVLRDVVIPALESLPFVDPFRSYHGQLHHEEDLPWHWEELRTFLEHPDLYVELVETWSWRDQADEPSKVLGSTGADASPPEVIRKALESIEAIAAHHDITARSMQNKVDAVGYASKIGENLQDWDFNIGDPVKITTEQVSMQKTLFCGPPNYGKSVGLEREAEDYLLRSYVNGYSDLKLIDPLGFRDGENWFYDIPQQDPELRRIRKEEFDLAPSFDEASIGTDREIQILLPLTPGLTDERLPFNVEKEEFVPKPFTIPAADIPKSFLIAICSARLTPEQEGIIRDAYDEVDHRRDDWTIADLAEEIRTRDELSDSKKKPVVRTLKQLQNKGFIRTEDSDLNLDWEDIYHSTDVVTVISQAYMEDDIGKLIVYGYLAHELFVERSKLERVPETLVINREFWKVAPHNRRQSFDARAANLQDAIAQMLTEVMRENRHSGLHVSCDTQEPSDLKKSIREMFDRYVVYGANKTTAKNITEWTGNDKWRAFYNTLSAEIGQASIIGQVQPAIDEKGIEFVGPVDYAPPSHHHRNADYDYTGATARARYTQELDSMDTEELRRPRNVEGVDWPDEVPPMLRVDAGYDAETGAPDVETNPIAAFTNKCLDISPDSSIKKDLLKVAFNGFAADQAGRVWDFEDHGVNSRFGRDLGNQFDEDDIPARTTKDGENALGGISLTRAGQEFLDQALATAGTVEDALSGEPLEEEIQSDEAEAEAAVGGD